MTEPVSLERAVQQVLQAWGVRHEVADRLLTEWEELAGRDWAARSRPAACRNGVLTVVARDGSAATYLDMRREDLVARLAKTLGRDAVTTVRVRVGRGSEV